MGMLFPCFWIQPYCIFRLEWVSTSWKKMPKKHSTTNYLQLSLLPNPDTSLTSSMERAPGRTRQRSGWRSGMRSYWWNTWAHQTPPCRPWSGKGRCSGNLGQRISCCLAARHRRPWTSRSEDEQNWLGEVKQCAVTPRKFMDVSRWNRWSQCVVSWR